MPPQFLPGLRNHPRLVPVRLQCHPSIQVPALEVLSVCAWQKPIKFTSPTCSCEIDWKKSQNSSRKKFRSQFTYESIE